MEFDEIVVKESPGLCRCCLSEGCYKDLGSEYAWMNDREVYADMLLECFDISISQQNEGPNGPNRLICEVCITRLRDACNFKKQVLDSEKKFIDMIGRGEFRPKVLIYQSDLKAEQIAEEPAPDAEEIEYLDEDIDFGDNAETLESDSNQVPVEDITVSALPVKGKRGRPRKNPETKPEKKPKVAKTEKARTSKVGKDAYEGTYERTAERRRKNLQILFNNTSVIPFKWRGRYLCFYCGENHTNYTDFRKHTLSHGPCSTKDYSLKVIKGNHIEIKVDVSDITCIVCTEPFNSFKEIIDHLIIKHSLEYDSNVDTPFQEYRLVDFRCLLCDKQFSYFGYLVQHVNNAHPNNCFVCHDCKATFNKKRDLSVHMRNFHRQGGYKCELCMKIFKSLFTLRKHQKNMHFSFCNFCGLSFSSNSLLQKHTLMDHPDDGSFKCNHCAKICHSSQGLKQHFKKCKAKLASIEPIKNPFTEECVEPKKKQDLQQIRLNIQCVLNMSTAIPFKFFSSFACFYCCKKFSEFEELKQHTISEHPVCDVKANAMRNCKGERITIKIDVTTLACKLCCVTVDNIDELVDHLIKKHTANYDKSITGCFEPYRVMKDNMPCPICPDLVFRYFNILLRHMNSVHNNNNRICDHCGRSFKSVTNLKVHIAHTHMASSECDLCGGKFKNQWCLLRHKASTHDVKSYKCSKCPEKFLSQYHKQKHLIEVHNIGHKCSYCSKMFTRNSFMKDHIRRSHLKEKNVSCGICNEKFFDNYLLKLHMVKHYDDRRFKCDVCTKEFLRRSNLDSHKKLHKKYGHIAAQT